MQGDGFIKLVHTTVENIFECLEYKHNTRSNENLGYALQNYIEHFPRHGTIKWRITLYKICLQC